MPKNVLTVNVIREKEPNMFCPRCGVVVPRDTHCVPSPTRPEIHYHPQCLLTLAQTLGRPILWA
jgi:hypothetical protein